MKQESLILIKNKEMEKLDYHEFYEEAGKYIPLRITDEWIVEHKEYSEEVLFLFHQVYDKSVDIKTPSSLLKLYGEVLNTTFEKFNVGYL